MQTPFVHQGKSMPGAGFGIAAAPSDNEDRTFISSQLEGIKAGERPDMTTWFDYLDTDDFASFGGSL